MRAGDSETGAAAGHAFTSREVLAGAALAVLVFVILGAILHGIVLGIDHADEAVNAGAAVLAGLGYAAASLGFLLPWSLGAAVVGSALALVVNRALAREPRRWPHGLACTLLGIAIGGATAALYATFQDSGPWPFPMVVAVAAALTGISTLAGWLLVARRHDRRGRHSSRDAMSPVDGSERSKA